MDLESQRSANVEQPGHGHAADPAVLHAYANAYNSGDAVAAAASFTNNEIWVSPRARGSCSQQTPCIGRAAILSSCKLGLRATFVSRFSALPFMATPCGGLSPRKRRAAAHELDQHIKPHLNER